MKLYLFLMIQKRFLLVRKDGKESLLQKGLVVYGNVSRKCSKEKLDLHGVYFFQRRHTTPSELLLCVHALKAKYVLIE